MAIELALLSRVAYRDQQITAPRLCELLALLASDLRAGCGTSRLIAGLWPDERPETPTRALQVLISRARTQLGADVIARTPTGYRLTLSEDQVDTSAVLLSAAASARHSRAGDHAAALAHAQAGLALWAGAEDVDPELVDPLSALRGARASTYRTLVRARALALSRLGRHAEAVEPLAELARELPRDEEVLLELLRCESATTGPAAALTRYDAYRRALREELGTDPGADLRAAYLGLLHGTSPASRYGVPHDPNPLLGRDEDLDAVANLLRTSRVTSIVGVGGLGKTRLAYAVSRRAEQRIVQLVSLAGVAGDADVAGEVASALGVGESPPGARGGHAMAADVLGGIAEALGPGPTLLVLDNCEHVIRGAAELVRALVSMTAQVRVLTTSRAPLGLLSESVYPLPELDLPTAVELFTQRARAARPGIELNPVAVSELCRHLDGLPLAVELAAARVRVMSVAEIAARLADRFTLLRGGARDAPERHHNLHAVIDWSWQLVEPAEQAAMRALSIFPGGFNENAARRLLGAEDTLRVLENLVDQSLLKVVDTPSGTRLRMLETVREFSAAHREQAGETDRVTAAFLAWARDFGVAQHDAILGPDFSPATARVRAEQDNLGQALRLALARGDGATVAATTATLGVLWTAESNWPRLTTLTEQTSWALSHFRPEPEFVEVTRAASAVCTGAVFALRGPRAVRSLVTLRRLPPAPPDTLVRAIAVVLAATPELLGPDPSALRAMCDSAEPWLAGAANLMGSYRWELEGDLDSALAAAESMLGLSDPAQTPGVWAAAHARLGELCMQVGQGELARQHLTAALPVLDQLGQRYVLGVRHSLAIANLQFGAVDEAERWWEQTAPTQPDESPSALNFDLGVRAEIALARGEVDAGLRLWRQAVDRLRQVDRQRAVETLDRVEPPELDPWALENQAAALIAHARHGRPEPVQTLIGELSEKLCRLLTNPIVNPPAYFKNLLVCGALLLALATVDLDRGTRVGDERVTASGARLVALAERFGFLQNFQPTMSAARARDTARLADLSAYEDAVTAYADLDRDELRAAALTAVRARGQR